MEIVMEQIIITIGRENGSGGRDIGEKLAADLGIKCYDKELFFDALKEKGLFPAAYQKFDEMPSGVFASASTLLDSLNAAYSFHQEQLYEAQIELISKIADSGKSCVLVGRSADYILRDNRNVVKVFICANVQSKAERTMEKHKMTAQEAQKWNQKNDSKRRKYYNDHTMQEWGMSKNYHLCIDTTDIGVDGAVALIEQYLSIRQKAGKRSEKQEVSCDE
jgi:cytidylate kinase